MGLKRFVFKIEIQGYGSTVDQAWNDAVIEFGLEAGSVPENYEEFDEEE